MELLLFWIYWTCDIFQNPVYLQFNNTLQTPIDKTEKSNIISIFEKVFMFIETLLTRLEYVLIAGDFNLHFGDLAIMTLCPFVILYMLSICNSIYQDPSMMVDGHTLDITHQFDIFISEIIILQYLAFDHSSILCSHQWLKFRLTSIAKSILLHIKMNFVIILVQFTCPDFNSLVDQYDNILSSLLYKHTATPD